MHIVMALPTANFRVQWPHDDDLKIMANGENEMKHASSESSQTNDHVAIKTDTFAIDEDALGRDLPKHYYRSAGFIGTVIASSSFPLLLFTR